MAACTSCGAENPDDVKFCGECGSPLALVCHACGAANVAGRKFCGECGTALGEALASAAATAAVPGQPTPPAAAEPVAERRLVSVLFADLVGFTSLSESRDPEEVRELLSRYFDSCRRLIELYGGTVEKFIGDAVMAVWGTPVATEDDAERAVRAALDLVAAVSALGDEVGALELRARAGVLTGEAAVNLAAMGEGMVAGDLVNTASRVQSVAEPGSVFVGEATRRATEQAIVYEDAGSFELKGKEGETQLWRALRVVSGVGGELRSEGLEAPFVGRDRELRQIKDLFHVCAEEGRAQLVSVTGIAGIGKSRLAWEFYKYFDGLEPDRVLAPRPLPLLRRGGDLLGAGGHGADALPDRRGRPAGRGVAEAPHSVGRVPARPGRAALRRAAAGAAAGSRRRRFARPAGPVRSLAPVLRAARRYVSDGAGLRGHAVGRRVAARLRRVPAGMVARQAAVRGHAGASGAARSGGRPGARGTATSPRSTWSRSRRRRWRSCSSGSYPGCR